MDHDGTCVRGWLRPAEMIAFPVGTAACAHTKSQERGLRPVCARARLSTNDYRTRTENRCFNIPIVYSSGSVDASCRREITSILVNVDVARAAGQTTNKPYRLENDSSDWTLFTEPTFPIQRHDGPRLDSFLFFAFSPTIKVLIGEIDFWVNSSELRNACSPGDNSLPLRIVNPSKATLTLYWM